MLCLQSQTPARWGQHAAQNLPVLLADHAHCELKAAQSALSLLARYGAEFPAMVAPLVALAQEETEHFAQVEAQLRRLACEGTLPTGDAYAQTLRKAARDGSPLSDALLDRLIVHALIEARSCERFAVLRDALDEGPMRDFYASLLASEARHYALFYRLARERFGSQRARARLQELAASEARIADALPLEPTVHG